MTGISLPLIVQDLGTYGIGILPQSSLLLR